MTAVVMALEHGVPEQLFSTAESPVEGVSAVKALQLATGQGIPIYTVTQDNIDTVLPQLQLAPEVINEIENAVNAGKEVTVAKTEIDFYGWIGCGYMVIDPLTGAGAYMISGGESGAWMKCAGLILLLISGLFLALTLFFTGATVVSAGVFLPVLVAILQAFYVTATLSIIMMYGSDIGGDFAKCFYGMDIVGMYKLEGGAIWSFFEKFLKSPAADVFGKVLTAASIFGDIYLFGKCVNDVLYSGWEL